jgi:hypothetical protein
VPKVVRWVAVQVSRVTSTLEKSITLGETGVRRTHSNCDGVVGDVSWTGRDGTAGKRVDKGGGGSFF